MAAPSKPALMSHIKEAPVISQGTLAAAPAQRPAGTQQQQWAPGGSHPAPPAMEGTPVASFQLEHTLWALTQQQGSGTGRASSWPSISGKAAQQLPSALYPAAHTATRTSMLYVAGVIKAAVVPDATVQQAMAQITAALRPVLKLYAQQCACTLVQANVTFIPDPAPAQQLLGTEVPTPVNPADAFLTVAIEAMMATHAHLPPARLFLQPRLHSAVLVTADSATAAVVTSNTAVVEPGVASSSTHGQGLPTLLPGSPPSLFDALSSAPHARPLSGFLPLAQGGEQALSELASQRHSVSGPWCTLLSSDSSSKGFSNQQDAPDVQDCGRPMFGTAQETHVLEEEEEGDPDPQDKSTTVAGAGVGGEAGAGACMPGQTAAAPQGPATETTPDVLSARSVLPAQVAVAPVPSTPPWPVQQATAVQPPTAGSLRSHLVTGLASMAPAVQIVEASINLTGAQHSLHAYPHHPGGAPGAEHISRTEPAAPHLPPSTSPSSSAAAAAGLGTTLKALQRPPSPPPTPAPPPSAPPPPPAPEGDSSDDGGAELDVERGLVTGVAARNGMYSALLVETPFGTPQGQAPVVGAAAPSWSPQQRPAGGLAGGHQQPAEALAATPHAFFLHPPAVAVSPIPEVLAPASPQAAAPHMAGEVMLHADLQALQQGVKEALLSAGLPVPLHRQVAALKVIITNEASGRLLGTERVPLAQLAGAARLHVPARSSPGLLTYLILAEVPAPLPSGSPTAQQNVRAPAEAQLTHQQATGTTHRPSHVVLASLPLLVLPEAAVGEVMWLFRAMVMEEAAHTCAPVGLPEDGSFPAVFDMRGGTNHVPLTQTHVQPTAVAVPVPAKHEGEGTAGNAGSTGSDETLRAPRPGGLSNMSASPHSQQLTGLWFQRQSVPLHAVTIPSGVAASAPFGSGEANQHAEGHGSLPGWQVATPATMLQAPQGGGEQRQGGEAGAHNQASRAAATGRQEQLLFVASVDSPQATGSRPPAGLAHQLVRTAAEDVATGPTAQSLIAFPTSLLVSVFNNHLALFARDLGMLLHHPCIPSTASAASGQEPGAGVGVVELGTAAAVAPGSGNGDSDAVHELQSAMSAMAERLLTFVAQHSMLACFRVAAEAAAAPAAGPLLHFRLGDRILSAEEATDLLARAHEDPSAIGHLVPAAQ